jgi:hypothetical protein
MRHSIGIGQRFVVRRNMIVFAATPLPPRRCPASNKQRTDMKLFRCQECEQLLYFENTSCERCGHRLGYLPRLGTLSALEPDGEAWIARAAPDGRMRFCQNAEPDACNWMIDIGHDGPFCLACRHNRTIPDLSDAANVASWRILERGKLRLIYTLLALRLPLATRAEDPDHGLVLDLLADWPDGAKVLTGHAEGVITLNLAEADDAERERRRTAMGEPYRTVLGHFRHEIAHYYWDVLVRDGGRLDACRAVFGDDSADYAAALKAHYERGPTPDWQMHYVSEYASAHPWEDFAETWAHYLHIIDTLEMAHAFGVRVRPRLDTSGDLSAHVDFDPHRAPDTQTLIDAWLPLSFAVNSLNRAMGQKDLYPFILSPEAIGKLGFIHTLVQEAPVRPAPP